MTGQTYNKRKIAMQMMASFILSTIVLVIVFWKQGFYPFGDKTLFLMDMKGQYLEFFTYLRYLLKGQGSLFYCWSRSFGGNFLGLFAYYVASPLSFLTVFFPLKKMPEAIMTLTVLKIGLSSTSFLWFARYIWDKNASEKGKWEDCFLVLFSVSYALISYNMVYSLCLMWLDGVIFLPLILYGAERVLDGKKGGAYYLFLTMLFFCNYYTGYMAGIFTVIYVAFRMGVSLQKNTIKQTFEAIGQFFLLSFLAVGTAAPLILPVAKDLFGGRLSSESYRPDTVTNFNIVKLFGKYHNGVYDSITNTGLPSIYCGYFVLLCVLLYFLSYKIKIREKILAFFVLVLLVGSFFLTKVDIFWHGMQYPMWFPYRYAFVFGFFFVYLALLGFQKGLVSFIKDKNKVKAMLLFFAMIGICIDLGTNASKIFQGLDEEFYYGTRQEYEDFLSKTEKLSDNISKKDAGVYRVNQSYEYSKNDAMLLGYRGMTHYSSTYNDAMNQLAKKLGMAQAYFWNSGYGATPLVNSLFSVKYVISDQQVPFWYEMLEQGNEASAYKNSYSVPMLYAANVTNEHPELSADTFENQTQFLNAISGENNAYFHAISYNSEQIENGWRYIVQAPSDNPLYLSMDFAASQSAEVLVNGNVVGNCFTNETNCNLYLGSFSAGETVVVECKNATSDQIENALIEELDTNQLSESLRALQNNGIQNMKSSGGKISGTITLKNGQKIMTSIPYDDGWTVKVDGKKVKTSQFADALLMFSAEEGTHTIEMKYISPGFMTGMWCCLVSVVIALFYLGCDVCMRKLEKKNVRGKITNEN